MLGSPSARPRPGCPGPSLPVRWLMHVLGISTLCPWVGAVSRLLPPLSLRIFGILGSSEMSVLLGTGFGACPGIPLLGGELEQPLELMGEEDPGGTACLVMPLHWGMTLCPKPSPLPSDRL